MSVAKWPHSCRHGSAVRVDGLRVMFAATHTSHPQSSLTLTFGAFRHTLCRCASPSLRCAKHSWRSWLRPLALFGTPRPTVISLGTATRARSRVVLREAEKAASRGR